MKRTVTLLIAIILLLSGCGTAGTSNRPVPAPQEISANDLLMQLLPHTPEGSESPEIVPTEELPLYLAIYGIDTSLVKSCAIARLGGSQVFELAVIDLHSPSHAAEVALLNYIRQRQGDFVGYAPDQAEIAANGTLFSVDENCRLILALTEDTPTVLRTLTNTGYNVNEVKTAREWEDHSTPSPEPEATVPTPLPEETAAPETTFTLPSGWYPYTDPRTDDMSIYDTSNIIAAWEASDPGELNRKDRQIYNRCVEIIAQCVTEEMTAYEKELAIYQWMTWNLTYDWSHQDPAKVTPRDSYGPYGALIRGEAVCLGFATSFKLLMDLLDIECITVVGAAFQSNESHAWNMVKLDGEWYCVDATWDLGGTNPYWRYFNVTSDYMAKSDHQWDYENIPMATATDHGTQS